MAKYTDPHTVEAMFLSKLIYVALFVALIVFLKDVIPWIFNNYAFMCFTVSAAVAGGNTAAAVAAKTVAGYANGVELSTRIQQRTGLTRKAATFAFTTVVINGNGTVNIGDLVQTPGGIRFKSLVHQTVSGSANINVQAVVAGDSGMVPANQITQFPIAIVGLVSVTNPEPTRDGFDGENDAYLLQRYHDYI